jgi:hypothetical protein
MLSAECWFTIPRMKLVAKFAVFFVATLALAQTPAGEVEITAEPHHHLALENEYVRAFKVEVAPHEATLMHRHRHDYMFVTLGATQVENHVAGKSPVSLKLGDGEARFTPGDFAHIAKNLSDTPFRNVTVELLQDEQAKKSPAKWDEERGLRVFNGGTQDILFVKDNARVSEVELQPWGWGSKPSSQRPAPADRGERSGIAQRDSGARPHAGELEIRRDPVGPRGLHTQREQCRKKCGQAGDSGVPIARCGGHCREQFPISAWIRREPCANQVTFSLLPLRNPKRFGITA